MWSVDSSNKVEMYSTERVKEKASAEKDDHK